MSNNIKDKPIKSEKVQKLKEKRNALNARIQMIEAREKTRERKEETRRKILVGAYFLDEHRKNEKMEELVKKLNHYLERNLDRKLFDLPELNNERK
jgi:hypothetical protein